MVQRTEEEHDNNNNDDGGAEGAKECFNSAQNARISPSIDRPANMSTLYLWLAGRTHNQNPLHHRNNNNHHQERLHTTRFQH